MLDKPRIYADGLSAAVETETNGNEMAPNVEVRVMQPSRMEPCDYQQAEHKKKVPLCQM